MGLCSVPPLGARGSMNRWDKFTLAELIDLEILLKLGPRNLRSTEALLDEVTQAIVERTSGAKPPASCNA